MELLTITLAANELKQFAKAGRYFEIIDSSYAVQVDFTGDQGQRSDSMINALSGLFVEDPYTGFSITNGAIAQSITLLLMENGRGGSRRQPGVVQVVDSAKERTRSNLAYADYGFISASLAARYGTLQFWNPAGSGRRLIIQKMNCSATVATSINIAIGSTQATTLRRAIIPKLSGGTPGSSLIKTDDTAAALSVSAQQSRPVLGSNPIEFNFREPYLIMPGFGLNIWGDPAAATFVIFADAEMIEEANT